MYCELSFSLQKFLIRLINITLLLLRYIFTEPRAANVRNHCNDRMINYLASHELTDGAQSLWH